MVKRRRAGLIAGACLLFILVLVLARSLARDDVDAYARQVQKECGGDQFSLDCAAQAVTKISEGMGLATAFSVLQLLYKNEPRFAAQCGYVATLMGKRAYEVQPDFTNLGLASDAIFCNYGFIQSYAKELLTNTADISKSKAFCEYVSVSFARQSTGAGDECLRGTGYALPFVDASLWGDVNAMVKSALEGCSAIAESESQRSACVAGVFRTIADAEIARTHGLAPEKPDPLGLCRRLSDQDSSICYGVMKYVLVEPIKNVDDPLEIERYIKRIYPIGTERNEALRQAAFILAYNRIANTELPTTEYDALVSWCARFSPTGREQCLQGIMVGIAKNGVPNEQDSQLLKACESVDRILKMKTCPVSQALGYLKGFYAPDRFDFACARFDSIRDLPCGEVRQ